MQDDKRNSVFSKDAEGIFLDFSRQKLTVEIWEDLLSLAKECNVHEKILGMMKGDKINTTENRSVLHTALRAPKSHSLVVDGVDVIKDVHDVLDRVETFSTNMRSGLRKGATGKPLVNVISIGIGGSYLGPEFVYEALRCDTEAISGSPPPTLNSLH